MVLGIEIARYGCDGGKGVFEVVAARQANGRLDCCGGIKWVRELLRFGGLGDFDGFGIILVVNEVIARRLVFGNVGLGGKIIGIIFVDI